MAVKIFLGFVTVLASLEILFASPTRRQLITITEASSSDSPVTNDGAVWDDNDEFDLDGQGWYSQPIVSPSAAPSKSSDYNYDDDYSQGNDNAMVDFGNDDDEDEDHQEQEAEEDDETNNTQDSEFLFLPPKDTRLMLEDDDEQSGPIKVRHTGRSSYPRVAEGGDNSVESAEDDKDDNEHPYEFAIDEDNKDDDDDEDEESQKDESVEALPRHEVHEDDDEEDDDFVSEDEDNDMFDNPEEDAAQVIYGDHVFLY